MTAMWSAGTPASTHGPDDLGLLDGLDALLPALMSFLACDAATYVELAGGHPVPVRQWQGPQAAPGEGADPLVWGAEVIDRARQQASTAWGAAPQGAGSVVAVPLTHGETTLGVLVLHGSSMRPPDPTLAPLLDAVAGLAARGATAAPVEVEARQAGRVDLEPVLGVEVGNPAPDLGDADGPHQAIALIDVFAFTVNVVDGDLQWRYLGPNSEAVFGFPLDRADTLSTVIRRHTHADDAAAAESFLETLARGQRCETELRLTDEDATTRWVSWRAVPRTVGGVLYVDGVATDVSARHSLGRSSRELAEAHRRYSREVDVRREHARAVRDANDSVLQRLFATGMRLQALQRRLDDTEAHAASAIAFQLDQAVSDLREVILNLNSVVEGQPEVQARSTRVGEE